MSSNRELRNLVEPEVVGETSRYLRRLIIEAPYIMARLYNPGGSILLLPTSSPDQISYGTEIGNDAHLDLIEAEQVLDRDFSKGEQDLLVQWARGFTSQQAADYNDVKKAYIIRKRRQRAIEKLETRMNGSKFRGSSNGIAEEVGQAAGQQSQEAGDTRRTQAETSEEAGNTAEPVRRKEETP